MIGSAPHARIGVLGVGRWGKNIVRAFTSVARAEVVAICDIEPERVANGVAPVSATRYLDSAALNRDPLVDAVAIVTPSHQHAAQALAALEAGKHVFIEKPLALSLRDARKIRDCARRSGCRAMVGHLLRYHPAIAELRRLVDAGELGSLERLITLRLGSLGGSSNEGPWWCLAPHDLSLAQHLFRADILEVAAERRVLAAGETEIRARLRMTRGSAELSVSAAPDRKVRRLVLVGSRRTAIFDDGTPEPMLSLLDQSPAEEFLRRGDLAAPLASLAPCPMRFGAPKEPLVTEAEHFVRALLDGTRIATDADEGCSVVAALEAGALSASGGGSWVRVERSDTLAPPHYGHPS